VTVFRTRRRTERPPRIVGRTPPDYAQELQGYLEKDHERAEGGIPGGFNETVPPDLVAGGAGSAGTESAGWMAADAAPPVPVDDPVAIGVANAPGSSDFFNHSDHVHAAGITGQGDILTVDDGGALTALPVGVYPQFLKANPGGAGPGLIWEDDFNYQGFLEPADNVAEDAFSVALPAAGFVAGSVEWSVFASDGTEHQTVSGITYFNGVNKAGVYSTDLTQENKCESLSAGTLSVVWSIVEGTNELTFQVTANTSLTPTTLEVRYKIQGHLDDQTMTLLGV